jgi:hypothetical protein
MKGKNGQVGEELTVIKLFINNYTRDLFSNRYIKRILTQILELNEYHFLLSMLFIFVLVSFNH